LKLTAGLTVGGEFAAYLDPSALHLRSMASRVQPSNKGTLRGLV